MGTFLRGLFAPGYWETPALYAFCPKELTRVGKNLVFLKSSPGRPKLKGFGSLLLWGKNPALKKGNF